jgi:hypothetical protein
LNNNTTTTITNTCNIHNNQTGPEMSTPLGGNRAKRKPNPLTFTGGSNIVGPSNTNTNTTTGNNPIAAAQWYDDTDPANQHHHHHHHRRQSQVPAPQQTETVGTLLASIANCMNEALRILMFADKRHWGPDEFEQTRALEDALDEAKRDFQALGKLVNGRWYYEHDRTRRFSFICSFIHLLIIHPFLISSPYFNDFFFF